MYSACPIIPAEPGDCPDFQVELPLPGPPQHIPYVGLPIPRGNVPVPFSEFVTHLWSADILTRTIWDVWRFNGHGTIVEFGQQGRKMIRQIVDHLRRLHLSSRFCGDLLQRVHIQVPDLTVTFPYEPLLALNNNALLCWGISDDTRKFRQMVAFLIRYTRESYGNDGTLLPLPVDFQFFFSTVFTTGLSSYDFNEVLEHSYYQLYHPAIFNAADRIQFLQLIMQYKNPAVTVFERHLPLAREEYMLQNWKTHFPPGHFLHSIMNRSLFHDTQNGDENQEPLNRHCPSIPRFLRNVHHHYLQALRAARLQMTYEGVLELLDAIFPGICSKVLDAILRGFNQYPGQFLFKLAVVLENSPNGIRA